MIPALCVVTAVVIVYGATLGFGARLAKLRSRRTFTNLIVVLPPVPPLVTVSDEDYAADLAALPGWMYDAPTVPLTDDELVRFEQIVQVIR